MANIMTHMGRTTYFVENGAVKVYATAQGGHVTADFRFGKEQVNPFFIAPWWKEGWQESFDGGLMNVLRGNFLCMPFGGDADGVLGAPAPTHGNCANECWSMDGVTDEGGAKTLQMRFDEGEGRFVVKRISVREGEHVVYEDNTIAGYDMKAPIAYHPTICLPDVEGAARLCVGGAKEVYTATQDFEQPASKGYALFKLNQRMKDATAVQTAFGTVVDATRLPVPFGYEDVLFFISDDSRAFCFTTVTYPDGRIYFQLKNPREFQSTMLWISNGGRHYAPWNGRVRSVMGIEEATSNFCYGAKASIEPNLLSREGIRTYVTLSKDQPTRLGIILGMAQAPKGFVVKDMVAEGNGVVIVGEDGKRVDVRVNLDFLK